MFVFVFVFSHGIARCFRVQLFIVYPKRGLGFFGWFFLGWHVAARLHEFFALKIIVSWPELIGECEDNRAFVNGVAHGGDAASDQVEVCAAHGREGAGVHWIDPCAVD